MKKTPSRIAFSILAGVVLAGMLAKMLKSGSLMEDKLSARLNLPEVFESIQEHQLFVVTIPISYASGAYQEAVVDAETSIKRYKFREVKSGFEQQIVVIYHKIPSGEDHLKGLEISIYSDIFINFEAPFEGRVKGKNYSGTLERGSEGEIHFRALEQASN
jgi:hypothetical protein